MAEAIYVREGTLSESVLAGSEAVFEIVCDLCDEEDLNLEAEGFCQDCNDFLCADCLKHHRKSRQTKNHTLLDKEHMPCQKPATGAEETLEDRCPTHCDELIKFFCGDHEELGCSVCMTVQHRTCEDVNYIKDLANDICESPDVLRLEMALDSFIADSHCVIRNIKSDLDGAENDNVERISKIKEFAESVISLIKQSGESMINQSEELKDDDVEHLTGFLDRFRSAMENAKKTKDKIDGLKKEKKNCQLFIAAKEVSSELSKLRLEHQKAKSDVRVRHHMVEINDELLCTEDILGKLTSEENLKYQLVNPMDMTLTHLSCLSVRLDTDEKDCYNTDLAIMPGERFVLADFHNAKVKLVDVSGNVQSELKIQGSELDPWGITKVDDETVACTLLSQQRILLLNVAEGRLSVDNEIEVAGKCRGIDYSGGYFAVSFEEPEKVEIMDVHGNVLRMIDLDGFISPNFVCFSRDNQSLYISDRGNCQVSHIALDGKVKATYKQYDFWPESMFVDDQGFLYVCDSSGNDVHVLSPDLDEVKTILSKEAGPKKPMCVGVSAGDNKLYIAGGYKYVYQYQLS